MKKIKNSLLAVAFLFVPALSLRGVTMQNVAAELSAYIGAHNEGIRESIPGAFQGQRGFHVAVDFHPHLPEGCEIIDMYGNNVLRSLYSGALQWIIFVFVRYRDFRFSLWYVVLHDNGESHFSTIVMPL